MKSVDGLKAFCGELASDQPSPGGGSASAAAGAMGASLLAMVCGITAKSKNREADRPELQRMRVELVSLSEELTSLAREDAMAYDGVTDAVRQRTTPGDPEGEKRYESALRTAAEVPLRTANACLQVLNLATGVATLGKKTTSSDLLVAVLLAEAGFKGAAANVRINTKDMRDVEFVKSAESRLGSAERSAKRLVREATDRIG